MVHRSFKRLLLCCFFFAAFTTVAQDWKQVYNEGLALYQNGKYPEALEKTKQAYALSKSLDPKNQVYTLQLLTSICLESNQTGEGLAMITEEENLFEKIEGATSGTFAEALRKHALLLMQKGAYAEARIKCEAALEVLKAGHQENSLNYATLLAQDGQLAALLGDLAGAKTILDQCLPKLAGFPEAGDDFVSALTVSAGIDKQLKDLPAAETKYRRLVRILEQNGLQKSAQYADATAALSTVLLQQGKATESATAIQQGNVGAGQKAAQFLKIAVDYHNLKQFDKAKDAYANAEKAAAEGHLENNTAFSIHLNFGKILVETNNLQAASVQLKKASLLGKKLYPEGSVEWVLLDFATADLNLVQHNTRMAVDLYMKAAAGAELLPSAVRKQLALHTATLLLNSYQNESAVLFLQTMGADKLDAQKAAHEQDLVVIYAQALVRSNKLTGAQAFIQEAVVLSTDGAAKTGFELALVQVLERKGEVPHALSMLKEMQIRTSLTDGQKSEVTYQIARLQQLLGQYPEAEKSYGLVIQSLSRNQAQKDPLLLQAYNSLAVLQTQLGNYDENIDMAEMLNGRLGNKGKG